MNKYYVCKACTGTGQTTKTDSTGFFTLKIQCESCKGLGAYTEEDTAFDTFRDFQDWDDETQE